MDHPYRKKVINIIITIIILIALGIGGYSYYKFRKADSNNSSTNQTNPELKNLINKVSKLYLLPEGEIPTIATVTDPASLKNKSFFNLAEKGDKVLIYSKAGRAILYRPTIDRIIEVSSINTLPTTTNNQNVEAPTEKSKAN